MKPNNFSELLKTAQTLYTNGHTFEDWKQFKDLVVNQKDFLKSLIGKETVATLKRYTYRADNKKQAVDSVFSSIAQVAILGDSFSYSPMDETWEQAFDRITSKYTEEMFLAYKAKVKEKADAKQKALTNPETLDEYRTFITYKGEAAFSPEQRIRYDELTADVRKVIKKREEERKSEVKGVENVNTEMLIKESYHAKKQIPLWVVVLGDRVEREVYNELNNRAKKLGGYYSSFRGNGAIPGFTFESKEAAELFTQVKDGDVDASEIKEAVAQEKEKTRAESLKEKGLKMIEDGEEELNRDRKANTHRRAGMAANAERKASYQIQFGKTLVKIADAMELGQIKYLDKLSNGKDLEQLQSILSMAKTRHIQAEKLDRNKYETSLETVNFAQLPHPVIYQMLRQDIERMKTTSGKKLAAARMLKRLGTREHILIDTQQRIEDYETLFCRPCVVFPSYRIDRYKEDLMAMKRIKRIGIDTIEELRAALRELISLKKDTGLTEAQKRELKIKELERQFIGTKIEGFFPTPQSLSCNIVELANLQEDDLILEPSAGLGHIADEIAATGKGNLKCIEYNSRLAEALSLKGYDVIHGDFLEHTDKYDKIVMNPPFENLQDVAHVTHAFSLLNDGGRLVAIMANNKHRSPEFLEMVDQYGYMEENPANSFASAFRPTGVSTITVVLDKR